MEKHQARVRRTPSPVKLAIWRTFDTESIFLLAIVRLINHTPCTPAPEFAAVESHPVDGRAKRPGDIQEAVGVFVGEPDYRAEAMLVIPGRNTGDGDVRTQLQFAGAIDSRGHVHGAATRPAASIAL